ncbi:MAG: PH domain-containing protein [Acidobacteriota bacterium]|nr:PH domain-containing protein [Acidobacteriota bacterium]
MQTSDLEGQWQALHPAMLLFEMLRALRGYVLPFIIAAVLTGGGRGNPPFFLMFLVIIPIMVAFIRFGTYRYKLDEGHVTIREGLLSRKVRRIPVRRIHNINTSQNVLARMLGVLRLDIETAGGGASEASLIALSRESVSRIQEYVRREKGKAAGDEEDQLEPISQQSEAQIIHTVTPFDIFLAGATTSRLGVIFIAGFAILEYTNLEWEDIVLKVRDLLGLFSGSEQMVTAGVFLVVLLVLVSWLLSIATAFIRWHGFTISRRGEDLEIRTGLLTLRQYTLPLDKIQALQCETTAIRRPFRLFRIRVRSAGHVGVQEQGRVEHDLLVPLTRDHRIDFFTRVVWPHADWQQVDWHGVHVYTRNRQFRTLVFMLLGILYASYHLAGGVFAQPLVPSLAVIVGVPLAWGVAHLTWRQTAFGRDADFVYIKTGFLGLHFWVIPVTHIQNVAIHQTPFQRIRGLASLVVDTAGAGGRDAEIPNIPIGIAWELFNRFSNPIKGHIHSMN